GDMLVNWMKQNDDLVISNLSNIKLKVFCTLIIFITIIVLAGLQYRQTFITLIIVIVWAIITFLIIKDVKSQNDLLLKKFFLWGIYFLLIGLFLEPYEGGIKKDHPTLSYYFVTVGLAIFSLIAFIIIIDILKNGKYLDILIKNGQNPMIAYAGISNLIPPILGLTGLADLLNIMVINPWMGFVKGVIITLMLGIIVKYFTKYKIFLRT
ncbi:MAG TPA: hypothetical protein PL041_13640, partial [Melioribacteraceae bacterium]|nr:hypothetical protein [Melioribacteraceae bacterium]